jgi:hypothetical protein
VLPGITPVCKGYEEGIIAVSRRSLLILVIYSCDTRHIPGGSSLQNSVNLWTPELVSCLVSSVSVAAVPALTPLLSGTSSVSQRALSLFFSRDFSLQVRGQQRLWRRGALADAGVRTVRSLRGVKHDAQGAHQSDGVSGGMGAHRADSARLGDEDA